MGTGVGGELVGVDVGKGVGMLAESGVVVGVDVAGDAQVARMIVRNMRKRCFLHMSFSPQSTRRTQRKRNNFAHFASFAV